MALKDNELLSSTTVKPFPRMTPYRVHVKEFATAAGSPTYKKGTPVGVVTASGKWTDLDGNGVDGSEVISGFVYPDDIVADATDEVLGKVMIEGEVHYDDLEAMRVATDIDATSAELLAALRIGPRSLGLHVRGLTQVR